MVWTLLQKITILLLGIFSYFKIKFENAIKRLTISEEVKSFIDENRNTWDNFSMYDDYDSNYILVDCSIRHVNYIYPMMVVGKYISEIEQKDIAIIKKHVYHRAWRKILDSFGTDSYFIYMSRYQSLTNVIASFRDATLIYRTLSSPSDILEIRYNDVGIGDLIYNTYLTKAGKGSINKLSIRVYLLIFQSILYFNYYERLLDDKNITAIVLRDIHYIRNGTLLRAAAAHEKQLDIYVLGSGRKEISIKKYNESNYREHDIRPTQSLFDRVYGSFDKTMEDTVDKHLNDRMEDKGHLRTEAFSPEKRKLGRAELDKELGLDPEKPIVVIMSHVFTDAVHVGDLLFDDYASWLQKTVEFAVASDVANWLVKPHPNEDANIYHCDISAESIVESKIGELSDCSVHVLPDDINTASLKNFSDIILTARGSAALEFGCFGIPSIIAGDSHYSEFGFTLEPETKDEYFTQLANIDEVNRLNVTEQRKAKTMAYIRFHLVKTDSTMIPGDIMDFWDFDMVKELNAATTSLKNNRPVEDPLYTNLQVFLEDDILQLLDYDLVEQQLNMRVSE